MTPPIIPKSSLGMLDIYDLLLNPQQTPPPPQPQPPVEPDPLAAPPPSWGAQQPQPQAVQPPPEPDPQQAAPVEQSSMAPNRTQSELESAFGIRTYGPKADAYGQDVDAYQEDQFNKYQNQGDQMEPQQFGKIEKTFLAEGPLKPRATAEAFMAKKTPEEIARYTKMRETRSNVVSPQEQLAKNKRYDEQVQQDRMKREQQRDRQREQGYLNRAATRDKSYDAWEQFRAINGVGGMGGYGGGSGVQARNIGGAILMGPNMGEPQYGYGGGGGGRRGRSPEELELERQELARRKAKDAADAQNAAGRNQVAGDRVKVTKEGLDNAMKRFRETTGIKAGETAQEQRDELDQLLADYDRRRIEAQQARTTGGDALAAADSSRPVADPRHPGKYVPGPKIEGSNQAIQRRIVQLKDILNRAHEQGVYEFNVDPTTKQRILDIIAEQGKAEPFTE
jgi:hypothetical protein